MPKVFTSWQISELTRNSAVDYAVFAETFGKDHEIRSFCWHCYAVINNNNLVKRIVVCSVKNVSKTYWRRRQVKSMSLKFISRPYWASYFLWLRTPWSARSWNLLFFWLKEGFDKKHHEGQIENILLGPSIGVIDFMNTSIRQDNTKWVWWLPDYINLYRTASIKSRFRNFRCD